MTHDGTGRLVGVPYTFAVALHNSAMDMDVDRLAARLAVALPDLPAIAPLTLLGAGFGSVVVETAGGVVFRIAKHSAAQRGHQREARLLPVVRRFVSDLPVPDVRYMLETTAAFPYGAVGYDKLTGRPLAPEDINDETLPGIAAQLAAFLTALHGIDLDDLRALALPRFPPAPERLDTLWQHVSTFLAQQMDERDVRAVRQWLTGLREYQQTYPYTPTLVHGDFWYENLLFDQEQRRLVGVLDFENAALGDGTIDLATQRYLGDRFADTVSAAYFRNHIPRDLARRGNDLLGLRELLSLEHGLSIGDVDPDALHKVRSAILATPR